MRFSQLGPEYLEKRVETEPLLATHPRGFVVLAQALREALYKIDTPRTRKRKSGRCRVRIASRGSEYRCWTMMAQKLGDYGTWLHGHNPGGEPCCIDRRHGYAEPGDEGIIVGIQAHPDIADNHICAVRMETGEATGCDVLINASWLELMPGHTWPHDR